MFCLWYDCKFYGLKRSMPSTADVDTHITHKCKFGELGWRLTRFYGKNNVWSIDKKRTQKLRLHSIEEFLALHFEPKFHLEIYSLNVQSRPGIIVGCWSLKRPNRIVLCLKIINSLFHYSNGCQLQVIINHKRCAVDSFDGFSVTFFSEFTISRWKTKNCCSNLQIYQLSFNFTLHYNQLLSDHYYMFGV